MEKKRDKVTEELAYVRLLCDQIAEMAQAELAPLAPPEPDVLITIGDSRIGIEVTEIHGNSRLRMIEGEQDKVVLRGQDEWDSRGLPPVAVWLHWIPTLLPRRLAADLPRKLVDFLASRLPPSPGSLEIDAPELAGSLGSNCGIEHLFLYTDWEAPSAWELGRRWNGGPAAPPLIQREIDRKNGKPAGYAGRYSERWLLLVHNGANPSSGFDIGPSVSPSTFVSVYNRVYLLSLLGPKVRRLQVRDRDADI